MPVANAPYRMTLWLVLVVSVAAQGQVPRQARPPVAPWPGLAITWKGTWDQTLEANKKLAGWQMPRVHRRDQVASWYVVTGLKKIALLEALAKRFPAETTRRAEAYRQIADLYGGMRSSWGRNAYLLKIIREFPGRKDLVATAYQDMANQPFDQTLRFPSLACWRGPLEEALAEVEKGRFARPEGNAVARAASGALGQLLGARLEYDRVGPLMARLERMGAKFPGAYAGIGKLLQAAGHAPLAEAYLARAGDVKGVNAPPTPTRGVIGNLSTDKDLQMRWETLKFVEPGKTLTGGQVRLIQGILDAAVHSGSLLRRDDGYGVSFWVAADQALRALPASSLGPLTEAQETASRQLAKELIHRRDDPELVRLARRFAWAPTAQTAMVDSGERALVAGRLNWALAAFQDVLRHSPKTSTRRAAALGLWLALAQMGATRSELSATMVATPDDVPMRWRGRTVTAGQIKAELLSQAPVDAGGSARKTPGRLVRRRIELPTGWLAIEAVGQDLHAPWPVASVAVDAGAILVGAPGRLARFQAGQARRPVWVQVPGRQPLAPGGPSRISRNQRDWWLGFDRRAVSVSSGRTAYLFRQDNERQVLAAVDVRTGRPRWTSAQLPGWSNVRPLLEAVEADGLVYLAAAAIDGKTAEVFLACLDAATGQQVWRQPLAEVATAKLDSAVGGGLTVYRGAVFCCTNLGIAARCDTRDGAVEWVRNYAWAMQVSPRSHRPQATVLQVSRGGAQPVVSGAAVVMAPRDHSGLLAMSARTGQRLWETPLVPSDEVLGVCGKALISVNHRWLAATDIGTGKRLWCRRLPAGENSRGVVSGPDVLVVRGPTVLRISGTTGKEIERVDLGEQDAQRVFLPDGTLVELVVPHVPGPAVTRPVPGADPSKLVCAWRLPLDRARVVFPPEHDNARAGIFWVRRGRWLAKVQTGKKQAVVWQRTLKALPGGMVEIAGRLIVRTGRDLTAIDADNGKTLWTQRLDFCPYWLAGDTDVIVADSAPRVWELHAAALDAKTGRCRWSRSFENDTRFRISVSSQGMVYRPSPVGPGSLSLYMLAVLPGSPQTFLTAEALVDPETGTIKTIRHGMPQEPQPSVWTVFAPQAIGYVRPNLDGGFAVREGDRVRRAPWKRRIDLFALQAYPWSIKMRADETGAYFSTFGRIYYCNFASGKETVYDVPPGPTGSLTAVLKIRRIGGKLVVVTGYKAQYLYRGQRKHPDDRWHAAAPKILVHVFDAVTAVHQSVRELSGVACTRSWAPDHDAQIRIHPDALIVVDDDGVCGFTFSTGS